MGDPSVSTCVSWCDGPACSADTTCTSLTTTSGAHAKVCLPCNLAYRCAAGTTCATLAGTVFGCMPSGTGKEGDTCDASVGAAVTCGDRLYCLANGGDATHGTCTGWCDAGLACPSGKTCDHTLTTTSAMLMLCF
jgi:hypothetical protein